MQNDINCLPSDRKKTSAWLGEGPQLLLHGFESPKNSSTPGKCPSQALEAIVEMRSARKGKSSLAAPESTSLVISIVS